MKFPILTVHFNNLVIQQIHNVESGFLFVVLWTNISYNLSTSLCTL